jgi:hypothetical protein
MATGTMNTTGITTMKRLEVTSEANVALDTEEGTNPSKSHQVRKTTTSKKERAVEDGQKMPTISR